MPFLLRNIPVALDEPEELILSRAAKRLKVPESAIRQYAIVRRSLDARRRDIHFSYHVEIALNEPPERERARLRHLRPNQAAWIDVPDRAEPAKGTASMRERPVASAR